MKAAIKEFLTDAAGRSPGSEVALSIREFIAQWGAKRRGYWYVQQIRDDLEATGLVTVPSFETGWIDSHIRLVPVVVMAPDAAGDDGVVEGSQAAADLQAVALIVGSLESSLAGIVAVGRDDSLSKAQSLMMQSDFSQLPVMQGKRKIYGAVSWESIAQGRMHNSDASLRDCMEPPEVVGINDGLIEHIPKIAERGYVFVKDVDECITGIVTTADLSLAFLRLAGPFLLIGEVERRLRRIASVAFKLDVLREMRDPNDTKRQIKGAEDLTLGEFIRLFESKDRWAELGWDVDREVFIDSLETLRELRNEVTHFNPDPIEPESLSKVRNLSKWLTLLSR
jgi:CBS domain-containing protein